jgi:hypothetical protein
MRVLDALRLTRRVRASRECRLLAAPPGLRRLPVCLVDPAAPVQIAGHGIDVAPGTRSADITPPLVDALSATPFNPHKPGGRFAAAPSVESGLLDESASGPLDVLEHRLPTLLPGFAGETIGDVQVEGVLDHRLASLRWLLTALEIVPPVVVEPPPLQRCLVAVVFEGDDAGPVSRVGNQAVTDGIGGCIADLVEKGLDIEQGLWVIRLWEERPRAVTIGVEATGEFPLKIPHECQAVGLRKTGDQMEMIAQKGKGDQLDILAQALTSKTAAYDPAAIPVEQQSGFHALGAVAKKKVKIRLFEASMVWQVGYEVAGR